MSEDIEMLIERILKNGGTTVSASDLDADAVSAIIEKYTARGWTVRQNGSELLFESKSERKLLKG